MGGPARPGGNFGGNPPNLGAAPHDWGFAKNKRGEELLDPGGVGLPKWGDSVAHAQAQHHTHANICTWHTHVHAQTYLNTYTSTHANAHTQARTQTRTHTHTHVTHTHM